MSSRFGILPALTLGGCLHQKPQFPTPAPDSAASIASMTARVETIHAAALEGDFQVRLPRHPRTLSGEADGGFNVILTNTGYDRSGACGMRVYHAAERNSPPRYPISIVDTPEGFAVEEGSWILACSGFPDRVSCSTFSPDRQQEVAQVSNALELKARIDAICDDFHERTEFMTALPPLKESGE